VKEGGLTQAEVAYIKAFTGSYSGVNEQLRAGHMTESAFEFKHNMNDALAKLPKFDGDVVYRKIGLKPDQIAAYEPGKIVHWSQFSSTSKDPDTWSGNTHFVIHNPRSGVDVQSISSHPSEAEVILPADTYYRVLSNQKIGDKTRVDLEEVVPSVKKVKKAS
jgi:hypothetical protein